MRFKAPIGYLKDTGTGKGLGVFASRHICAGEVVEASPVILIDPKVANQDTGLKHSIFCWRSLGGPDKSAVCLGYGGMYNHANPANLIYSMNGPRMMKFVAARDISEDEEMTVNYNHTNGGTDSNDDVWFRTKGISVIG